MATSLATAALEFATKYPTPGSHPNGGGTTWDQWCGALVFRFGVYTTLGWAPRISGPTAWDVAKASGYLHPHAADAPIGAIHFFRSSTTSGAPGHTGVDLLGAGRQVFMATRAVTIWGGATALGVNSISGYLALRPAMTYAGWSLGYAGAQFRSYAPAPAVVKPPVPIAPAPAPAPAPPVPAPPAPAPAPAPPVPGPPDPSCVILFQGLGMNEIYELVDGKKRLISPAEFSILRQAASVRTIPAENVALIPDVA